jgi:branched-chain amino acid aminotransferase/4-amino-4-deoxychorismate lyase
MKAIFNGEMLEFNDIKLSANDRGFRYGDGLFETIAIVKGAPRLLDRHFGRIVKGAKVYGFNLDDFGIDKFEQECLKIIKANAIDNFGKIRMTIWRRGNGLYEPKITNINYLLTTERVLNLTIHTLAKVDFSNDVLNYPTKYSAFKNIGAQKYVLAGLEKKEKRLDEIIINDYQGYVSETLYSNIFIKKGEVYFTPPLQAGCIDGIMRGWLMNELNSKQIAVQEQFFKPNKVLEADAVFTTNAMGIKHITGIKNLSFKIDNTIQELSKKMN